MANIKTQKPAQDNVGIGEIPAGHAITLAEEKLVNTVNNAIMDSAEIFQLVGRIQMADFYATVSEKSIAEFYIQIKESKQYKGLPYKHADGNLKHVSDLEEFCQVFLKRSYRRCKQIADNYRLIGADLYEASEQLGLGQRDYNAIKALPEDQQSIIHQAIEKADSREVVISLIEDLANRSAIERKRASEEKDELTKKLSDMQADAEATDKVLGDKSAKLDQMEKEIHKLRNKSGDWHPRAFEVAMETTRSIGMALEQMDKLEQIRDAILNEDFGEDVREQAIEAMAVVYYDGVERMIARLKEIVYARDEVFIGYAEKASPIVDVFGQQGQGN